MNELVKTPLTAMAARLEISGEEIKNVLMNTVMPAGGKDVTPEQFTAFIATANNYGLDPLKREIYAFPAKGGGIQPVVGIDGWLSIINSHADFDGMELNEQFEDGHIFSVTCTIHHKKHAHPTVITEYLSECKRKTDPWNKPIRMLRHKAVIQAARYAFGLSGIVEPDEAEAALHTERDITPRPSALRKPSTPTQVWPDPEPCEEDLSDIVQAMESAKNPKQLQDAAAPIADLPIDDDTKLNLRQLYTERLEAMEKSA